MRMLAARLRDIWDVENAVGSGTWPEWIGGRAHDFKVETDPSTKRIKALVHKTSGHRRTRSSVEAAISKRIKDATGQPADIRDLVGGPTRPLVLDDEGKTIGRSLSSGTPKHLPVQARHQDSVLVEEQDMTKSKKNE